MISSRKLLKNGCELVFADVETFEDGSCPSRVSAVLLGEAFCSAKRSSGIDDLISLLKLANCRYFCCAGRFAEEMHDRIDEYLLQLDESDEILFTTTFHRDEPYSDTASYFLCCTSLLAEPEKEHLFLAILDNDEAKDNLLEGELLAVSK
ncbi:hypothetical protein MLD52_11475 [Puniceicoccaceae bacterium K14]|nr:hypothetical protein [Puniceicoccaceae bacterium K14]